MRPAEGLGGQGGAQNERRPAADDAVGAEHAPAEIGDVHRAALAAAQPTRLAEQFEHHPAHVAAFGDRVAVPAMGAGDHVLGAEMQAHPDRGRLLAGIEMDKAGNPALRELLLHPFLELADRRHAAIGLYQVFAAQLHRWPPSNRLATPDTARFAAASQCPAGGLCGRTTVAKPLAAHSRGWRLHGAPGCG
jgi:hypothetical protein